MRHIAVLRLAFYRSSVISSDRFSGTLIVTGRLTDVTSAMESVVGFFRDELGFPVCEIHRS